jgi:hypothetical protein
MNPQQLAEVICAAHLAHHVEGTLQQRGGLMLVGPPGTLKSTLVETLSAYSDALILTDINMMLLADLRDSLAGGSVTSLVFTELAKIYERNPQTAFNVEGSLRALASEGFAAASFQDHRIARRKAHATLIGAMPPSVVEKHFKRWEESGFNRRFLWAVYGLKNAQILDEAASELRRLDFGVRELPRVPPLGKTIPEPVDERRARESTALCCAAARNVAYTTDTAHNPDMGCLEMVAQRAADAQAMRSHCYRVREIIVT